MGIYWVIKRQDTFAFEKLYNFYRSFENEVGRGGGMESIYPLY